MPGTDAHLVFVTKYRHQVVTARHLERLEQIMRDVCADFGTGLAEFNGDSNHVHPLVHFPPKVALSRLVNRRVVPPDAAGVPRPGSALLAGEPACG